MQNIYRFRPKKPVGTGPFAFSFVTGSDLGLVKFQDYWQAKNITVDEIRIIKSVSNDITWAYLISGNIDATHPATPQDVTEQVLKLNKQVKLYLPSDHGEFGFIFNTKKKPLSDLNFRKAIAYAVNKDTLRMISYYYSTTIGPYNTGVLHSYRNKWIAPEFYKKMTKYDYNPKKAEQLLQASGYKKGKDGFYTFSDGKPISIEVCAIAGYSDWVMGCESLTNQLQKIGIKAQIRTYESSLFNQLLATNKFDIAAQFGVDYRAYAHPAPSFNRYYGKGAYIKVASGVPDKLKSYTGEVISLQKILKNFYTTRDKKEIQDTVHHLAWVSNEYLPFLSIYEKNLMLFVSENKRVKGWPKKDDPIWSICCSGLESLFAYLMATGTLKGVR